MISRLIPLMAAAQSTLMIDIIGSAATAAYGLRKLRRSFAGSCMRIRRASDNAEQDIGFNGEAMDWAAAIAFKGASTVFVKTWYDQSGNAKDASQTTTANQPQLDTTNFEIDFDGSNDYLATGNIDFSATNKVSFFLISRSPTNAGGGSLATHFWQGVSGVIPNGQVFKAYHDSTGILTIEQQNGSSISHTDTFSGFTNGGFDKMIYGNFDRDQSGVDRTRSRTNRVTNTDSTNGNVGTGNFQNNPLYIGASPTPGLYFNGSMKELILWGVTLSDAARDKGEANIQTFYFGGYDVDAKVYFDQVGISDSTQKTAINTFFNDLKTYSLWAKIKAGYLFIGGTAATHKWNFKDPRDLDAAFRLVYAGTITHDSNGFTGNGTTGWADTKLNPFTNSLNDNDHLSIYIRNTGTIGTVDIGGYNDGDRFYAIKARNSSTKSFMATYSFSGAGAFIDPDNASTPGFYIVTRRAAADAECYKNGVSTGTAGNSTQDIPSVTVGIGGLGGATTKQFSNNNYAFASIGTGLTDTEAANLYTAVQAMETTLSRQI